MRLSRERLLMRRVSTVIPAFMAQGAEARTRVMNILGAAVWEIQNKAPWQKMPMREPLVRRMELIAERSALSDHPLPYKWIDALIQRCPLSALLPVGVPHGDLTLSNILVHPSGRGPVWVIDPGNIYMNSLVLDLAKMRQDTHFGWSWVHTRTDPQGYELMFWELNARIRRAVPTIDFFDLVNTARIWPYARDTRVRGILYDFGQQSMANILSREW
jgi:hypothetical protein